MNELEEARLVINEVDAEMAKLFCRRMDAVRHVAAYKQAHGLPILNAGREAEVIARNAAQVPEEYRPYYEEFLRREMALSKEFQAALLDK